MALDHARAALLIGLLIGASLLFFNPVEPAMTTEVIFDDEVVQRIESESEDGSSKAQLMIRIRHDDGGLLTNDIKRVQDLLVLQNEAMSGNNPDTSWDDDDTTISTITSPLMSWSDAFSSRNQSLEEAASWGSILSFQEWDGWCGESATEEEKSAFESTLLLLPSNTTFNVACPGMPSSHHAIAPAAYEILWLVRLETDSNIQDWGALSIWAEKVSENTDYQLDAVGINMLFSKAKDVAEDDLKFILIPSIIILTVAISVGLRDPITALATLGGVSLVIVAELGILSALGFQFSILDGIAIPIIMGVAVDGAFWYCKSSRSRDEVRSMLFVAMVTTVAAVSLAIISPVRAQRSLGLVMAIGIILDWLVTRFLLEEFYLKRRSSIEHDVVSKQSPSHPALVWCWPVALILLASVAIAAPPGVEPLDIHQFLPEDDPALIQQDEIESTYLLASTAIAWIVVDVDGNSVEDYQSVLSLQQQLGQHPSVVSLDNGISRTPMVIGLPSENTSSTIDSLTETSSKSLLFENAKLQRNGITTGVAIAVLIDGQNTESALQFTADVSDLLVENGIDGAVGGELPVGSAVAQTFEEERIPQILAAGIAIFLVAMLVLRSPIKAMRIAIGTIAIGIAVDGLATIIGGRGVNTAPSVLLGMGFTADYLSHASADHVSTRQDTAARWWAAFSSGCVFLLVGMSNFPPARNSGQLLSLAILLSVALATCLSLLYQPSEKFECEE